MPLGFTCSLPAWVEDVVDFDRPYASDDDKMALAIDLSLNNVIHATGGPVGALPGPGHVVKMRSSMSRSETTRTVG